MGWDSSDEDDWDIDVDKVIATAGGGGQKQDQEWSDEDYSEDEEAVVVDPTRTIRKKKKKGLDANTRDLFADRQFNTTKDLEEWCEEIAKKFSDAKEVQAAYVHFAAKFITDLMKQMDERANRSVKDATDAEDSEKVVEASKARGEWIKNLEAFSTNLSALLKQKKLNHTVSQAWKTKVNEVTKSNAGKVDVKGEMDMMYGSNNEDQEDWTPEDWAQWEAKEKEEWDAWEASQGGAAKDSSKPAPVAVAATGSAPVEEAFPSLGGGVGDAFPGLGGPAKKIATKSKAQGAWK